MIKLKRRIGSAFLACMMLLSLLPITAFAGKTADCSGGDSCTHEAAIGSTHYDTIGEAIDAANNASGSTVKLLKDATLKDSYLHQKAIMKNMTLDLGGHTLKYAGVYGFTVNYGVTFTIQNGTYENTAADGTGIQAYKQSNTGCTIIIKEDATIEAHDGIVTVGYTDLTVKGNIISDNIAVFGMGPKNEVTLDGAVIEAGTYGVYQQSKDGGSTYTIKNSTITTPETGETCAVFISNKKANAEDTQNQGMQTLIIENSVISGQDGIEVMYTDVTISGEKTEVTAAENGHALGVTYYEETGTAAEGTLSITGGTFNGDVGFKEPNNATLTISGGKFTDNVSNYLSPGMTQDKDGNVVVDPKSAAASIGDEYYLTLAEAIEAAQSGNTITLLKDITLDGTVTLDKAVTLTAKGGVTVTANTSGNSFMLSNEATLDGLTINLEADNTKVDIIQMGSDSTVKNCTVTGQYKLGDSEASRAIVGNAGAQNLTITGNTFKNLRQPAYIDNCTGTISGNYVEGTRGWVICSDSTMTITGNTFGDNAVDIAIISNNNDTNNYADQTVALSEGNNGAYVQNQPAKAEAKDGVLVVGPTGDYTLEKAIAAAQSGDTIVLAAGTYEVDRLNLSDKTDLTIQGAGMGKTILKNTDYIFNLNTGDCTGLTIKDLTLKSEGNTATLLKVGSNADCSGLTLENVAFEGGKYGIYLSNDADPAVNALAKNILIDNCQFSGMSYAGIYAQRGDITVTGSTFEDIYSTDNTAAGILFDTDYFAGNSYDLTITDSSFKNITGTDASNKATGGVSITGTGTVDSFTLTNNRFEGNTYDLHIGKVDGAPTFKATTIYGNGDINVYSPYANVTIYKATFMNGDTFVDLRVSDSNGKVVMPAAPSRAGYSFRGWYGNGHLYAAGQTVQITKDTTFVAQWSDNTPYYTITVKDAENGTVTCYAKSAAKGADVTLNVKADVGYQLDKLTVTDASGNVIDVEKVNNTTYTFVMPGSKVTVEAVFAPTSVEPSDLPFTDVSTSDWFYGAVKFVYENGLMDGVGNNLFAPNATLNRAMAVTILYRLEGSPAVTTDAGFNDVAAGTWYTDAVNWAAANNIVNGVEGNNFDPTGSLTREQMATVLYRYAQYKGADVSASGDISGFVDSANVSSWAADAVKWAVGSGLVNGVEGNALAPQGTSTRAQAATVLMRFVG